MINASLGSQIIRLFPNSTSALGSPLTMTRTSGSEKLKSLFIHHGLLKDNSTVGLLHYFRRSEEYATNFRESDPLASASVHL